VNLTYKNRKGAITATSQGDLFEAIWCDALAIKKPDGGSVATPNRRRGYLGRSIQPAPNYQPATPDANNSCV
jgi:hypothetical protein